MIVRPLAPADHVGWSEMRQKLWSEPGRDDLAERDRLHVPNVVLVAEYEGCLVGFAEATVRSVVDGFYYDPAVYLEGIWVEPAMRRKGIARALVDAVAGWARGQGVGGIGSDALADNAESIAWHRAVGFGSEEHVVRFALPFGDEPGRA